MLNPIKKAIPTQLSIFKGGDGLHFSGVCFPDIKMKFKIAKKGAVKNASMVATLTKTPICDIKNIKIKMVPKANTVSQNQYIFLKDFLVSRSNVLSNARGEAYKQVIVVLNIAVNAAAAIIMYKPSPKLCV